MMMPITRQPLDVNDLLAAVQGPERGGTCALMPAIQRVTCRTSLERLIGGERTERSVARGTRDPAVRGRQGGIFRAGLLLLPQEGRDAAGTKRAAEVPPLAMMRS